MDYEKAWVSFREDIKEVKFFREKYYREFDSDLILGIINNLLFQMETYEEMMGSTPVKNDFRMKGWDYSELLEKFGISDYDPEREDDPYFQSVFLDDIFAKRRIVNFLQDNSDNPEVIAVVREYLELISDCDGYYGKVWKAMTEIDEDVVFLQFVFALVHHMWT